MRLTMILTFKNSAFISFLGRMLGRKNVEEQTIDTKMSHDSIKTIPRVLNLILLDESGSMKGWEVESVSGVNQTISTIKSTYGQFPEQEQYLTFVTFSNRLESFCRIHYELENITQVSEYTLEDYLPCGGTPLYDTMGAMLSSLDEVASEHDIVLVTIITDGYENSSREYDSEKIRALIQRLDEKDWVFTYIGANQDSILEARKIGILNALDYRINKEGISKMWGIEKVSRIRFMSRVRIGKSPKDLKYDYFAD